MQRGFIILSISGALTAVMMSTLSTSSQAMVMSGHDTFPQCAATPDNGRCYTGDLVLLDTRLKGVLWSYMGPGSPCILRGGSTETFSSTSITVVERTNNQNYEWVEIFLNKETEKMFPTAEAGSPTPPPLGPYSYDASELVGAMGKVVNGTPTTWTPEPIMSMVQLGGKMLQLKKKEGGTNPDQWVLLVDGKTAWRADAGWADDATVIQAYGETNYWKNDIGVTANLLFHVYYGNTWKTWPLTMGMPSVAEVNVKDNQQGRYFTNHTGWPHVHSSDHHFPSGAIDACGYHTRPSATPTSTPTP